MPSLGKYRDRGGGRRVKKDHKHHLLSPIIQSYIGKCFVPYYTDLGHEHLIQILPHWYTIFIKVSSLGKIEAHLIAYLFI